MLKGIALSIRARMALLVAFGAAAPVASAQYQANVLYKLSAPTGVSSFAFNGIQNTAGGQAVGYGAGSGTGFTNHALFWDTQGNATDLTPAGYGLSFGTSTNGTQQVGSAALGNTTHAMLWFGSSTSYVDLNPAGYSSSYANGTDGTYQVGQGTLGGVTRALMWNLTNVPTVLGSSNYQVSGANAVKNGKQVGWGYAGGVHRAVMWSGGTGPEVDLHPTTGYTETWADGLGGNQQVGYGDGAATGGTQYSHALLWSGTAASMVDLNPAGYQVSSALDTNGSTQVGFAALPTSGWHATAWNGSANSYTDLQSTLPFNLASSIAYTIDSSGNIFGAAFDGNNGIYAVEWTAVPEPSSLIAGIAGALLIGCRRRRHAAASNN